VRIGLQCGMRALASRAQHVLDDQRCQAQLQLAAGDPADVHQVIDHAGQVRNLPADDRGMALQSGFVLAATADQFGCAADGRQRVPQFVRESRQELVLALVRL
jgi:hypothetical protein